MNRTYGKLIRRSVKGTLTRFLSILAIVTVGAGFLAGLLATTPDMQETADKYYDDHALFDVNVRGSLGLTEEDAAALAALEGVEQVMPAYVTDLNMESSTGSYVTRVYGVPLEKHGSGALLNDFELVEGRLPEGPDEALAASPNGFLSEDHLGETFTIGEDNKGKENYALDKVTVVGLVRTPYYLSVESEPSTVGTGAVGLVLFVLPEFYDMEVYTDLFLTAAGTKAENTFSQAYADKIEALTARLEDFGLERSQIRHEEIVTEAQESLDEAQKDYDKAKAEAEQELQDARRELDEGWAALADGEQELADSRNSLAQAREQLLQAEIQVRSQAQAAREELAAMETMMPPEQYAAALAQIDQGEQAGLAQIFSQYDAVEDGEAALAEGEAELEDARLDLAQGEADYETGKAEAEQELADAQAEIDEARQEIQDLETPEWFITDREDTVSYSSYKSNSEKVAAIAKVFPVFFFLVAALVALTTMTRMVEEERGQIGTLKALGYSNGKIAAYYLGYSILASLIGAVIGCLVGFYLLPLVISNAYGILYTLPPVILRFRWDYSLFIIPITVGCTTIATLTACINELREKPASLMLPKAPKAGKRIFLEYMGPLWRRLRFTQKVAARNIFRYKKRLFMTVLGIAGCTALLLTGFGVRDSIHDIVDKQFGEIYRYNLSLYLSSEAAAETDPVIRELLDSPAVESWGLFHTESGSVEFKGDSEKLNFYVPKNTEDLKQQVTLRERRSGADIPFDEDSLVLTEKVCEKLGIRVGDQVTLKDADGRAAQMTVSAIGENYVASHAFFSAQAYQENFGSRPDFTMVMAQAADESKEAREALSKQVLESDEVLLVQFSQTIRESFQNTVQSIDYIVVVLILSAGLLAIVVLYNLTNINISERKKELATVKVLGFHEKEVASYIYRETTVLCLLGILAGFLLGIWLHSFVVRTAEVDAVMFGRAIKWQSYLYSALVTGFFTVVVDLLMLKKLRRIDMVESMKANE